MIIVFLFLIAFSFLAVIVSSVIAKIINMNVEKKVNELKDSQKELNENVSKIISAKSHDYTDLKRRVEMLEEKIEVLLMPEGKLKETEIEKIRVSAKHSTHKD